jgi:hypothetical protein
MSHLIECEREPGADAVLSLCPSGAELLAAGDKEVRESLPAGSIVLGRKVTSSPASDSLMVKEPRAREHYAIHA